MSSLGLDSSPERTAAGGEVGARSIRMRALVGREVARFWKIKRQTLGAPILETFLYISVFGAALGRAIHTVHGYRYIIFVLPGLIMMAFATNAFANNSSSILQQKFTHAIDDQLSSPASPAELLLGFTLGGFIRGLLVSGISCTVAGIVAGEPIREPLVLIPSIILVGLFFANAGVLVGVRAQQFDDVALYQTFVLQPLIFLGGVFYSASSLPAPWGFLTHFDPLYYMIALVRYGFIGFKDTSILVSFLALFAATVGLFALNVWIFAKGRYLRT